MLGFCTANEPVMTVIKNRRNTAKHSGANASRLSQISSEIGRKSAHDDISVQVSGLQCRHRRKFQSK